MYVVYCSALKSFEVYWLLILPFSHVIVAELCRQAVRTCLGMAAGEDLVQHLCGNTRLWLEWAEGSLEPCQLEPFIGGGK